MPPGNNNLPALPDMDVGFKGMVSRLDPSLLGPGFVAKATNRRFDNGRIANRWGVVRPIWGGRWVHGQRGLFISPGETQHQGMSGAPVPVGKQISCDPVAKVAVFPIGTKVVEDTGYFLTASIAALNVSGQHIAEYHAETTPLLDICGILTYRDSTGTESLLVAVNEAREGSGRGNVYILKAGQSHSSILTGDAETIPMNGHDFYGPVKMIRTASAVVMLRPGPVRYYVRGNDVGTGGDNSVRLAVVPDFASGTKVLVSREEGSAAFGKLLDNTFYFARVVDRDVSFYVTRSQAEAGGSAGLMPIVPSTANDHYFITVAESVNWWSEAPSVPPSGQETSTLPEEISNDGPPLIMQSKEGKPDPLDAGFDRFPSALTISAIATDLKSGTVLNHRLAPGERVIINDVTYYIYPNDAQTIKLYNGDTGESDSLTGAVAEDGTEADTFIPFTPDMLGDSLRKAGSSGAPIPAGREGLYFSNRLVVVYGFDNIAVSDILDPLNYLPLLSEFKLNTGTNDPVTALYPFNQTTLLVFKERSILAIENIFGDMANVRLVEITREFGCVATKSIVSTGADVIFLSTRGVASLKQTEMGLQQSVVIPLSDPIQDVMDTISQPDISKACAAYWDNRYILSVSTDGRTNNVTLVFNFLNQAWDGIWNGSYLQPLEYERFDVNGTLRLVWADSSGFVHYFSPDALLDSGADQIDIFTEVRFRAYTCGLTTHKQFTEAAFNLASFNPLMDIRVYFDGVDEVLTLARQWTRDRSKFTRYGLGVYKLDNSQDNFLAPYREDYALKPGFKPLSGVKTNLHQTYNLRSSIRQTGAHMQPVLTTFSGSVDIFTVDIGAIPARVSGTLND